MGFKFKNQGKPYFLTISAYDKSRIVSKEELDRCIEKLEMEYHIEIKDIVFEDGGRNNQLHVHAIIYLNRYIDMKYYEKLKIRIESCKSEGGAMRYLHKQVTSKQKQRQILLKNQFKLQRFGPKDQNLYVGEGRGGVMSLTEIGSRIPPSTLPACRRKVLSGILDFCDQGTSPRAYRKFFQFN